MPNIILTPDHMAILNTCVNHIVCDECSKVIQNCEISVWVRRIGPQKKSRIVHKACYVGLNGAKKLEDA